MVGVGGNSQPARGRWRATHLARAATAFVVVAGVVAVAFASGYSATRALTKSDSAWLRKGDTIVHVNGPSGRFDAVVADRPTALASSRSDPVEVVQQPDGQVFTADPVTHQVFRVDPITMAPQPGPPGTAVLAAGSTTYVVDRESGTVTPVDPQTLAPGRPISVPRPIVSQAIGPDGTAYVASAGGSVTTIRAGKVTTSQVAGVDHPLDLTVVGSQPAAVDPVNGTLYPLGPGRPRPVQLPGVTGAPVQLTSSLAGQDVWLIRGGMLVSADPATGQTQSLALPAGGQYGAPVVNADRVYVPDQAAGTVLIFDAAPLNRVGQVAVPRGAPGSDQIEIVVQDGKVWVDNPTSRDGKLVNPDGSSVTLDKGTGNQVVDPNATPHPAPPSPPVTTPVTVPATTPSPTPLSSPVLPPVPTRLTPVPPLTAGQVPARPAIPPPVPSTPKATAPPTTTAPSAPTTQPSAKVPKLIGLGPSAACSALQGTTPPLTCGPHDQGQAPSGTSAGVVTGQSPAAGASAAARSPVTFDYYGSVAVPGFSGKSPGAYCAMVDNLGLKCSPSASQGPNGAQTNVVESVSPGPGSVVAYGTPVTASYYSSTQPPPKVAVPNCIGSAPSACPNPGLNYAQASQSTAAAVPCGTVWQENPPAGTMVDQGSQVLLVSDPNCAVPLYEWNRQGTHIWYLTTSTSTPVGGTPSNPWVSHGGAAGAYPFVNNTCAKAGTTPLYRWQYVAGQQFPHHYFTIDPNWHNPGWVLQGVTACVFNSHVTNSNPVYGHYINRGQPPPGDWYWSLQADSQSVLVWYQPPP